MNAELSDQSQEVSTTPNATLALTDELGTENWFINAELRAKTKTREQRKLDFDFFRSCENRNHELSVELFQKGATNDYIDNYGQSALHFACLNGDLNIAKLVIGRYPEEIDREVSIEKCFCTPIAFAFWSGQTELAEWLLQMGAKNAIYNAIFYGDEKSFEMIDKAEIAPELIIEDLEKCFQTIYSCRFYNAGRTLELITHDPQGVTKLMKYYEKNDYIFSKIIFTLLSLKSNGILENETFHGVYAFHFPFIDAIECAIDRWDWESVLMFPSGPGFILQLYYIKNGTSDWIGIPALVFNRLNSIQLYQKHWARIARFPKGSEFIIKLCVANGAIAGLKYVKDDSILASVSEVLNSFKNTNTKLATNATLTPFLD